MNHLARFAVLGVALVGCGTIAQASPISITSGQTEDIYNATGLSIVGDPIMGSVVYSSGPTALTFGALQTFTATIQTTVFRDSADTLSGCSGQCLTFEYRVSDISGDGISEMFASNFRGYLTYVGFLALTGSGTNNGSPTDDAAVVASDNAGVINFLFTGSDYPGSTSLAAGNTSDILFIQTNATAFTTGGAGAQDGSNGSILDVQPAPAAITPEPSSLLLLGSGMLSGARLLVSRRKATTQA